MLHMIKKTVFLISFLFGFFSISCKEQVQPSIKDNNFAKGADVSWITEMEASGLKFYNSTGTEMECMKLLKTLGMNSIRLRVWVDPQKGWNSKEDVLVKAIRAKSLGMRVMIDFHYSDTWADPKNQIKPAAWRDLGFEELKSALKNHTTEVLNLLKKNNIEPEWVQVGNETAGGMLWEDGRSSNMKNYAELNNAGYDAVKSVFPNCKVIVHLENGEDNGKCRWFFDALKNNGGKWDVIGLSLYPIADWREDDATWQTINTKCFDNMNDLASRYNCEVMVSEVGFPWDQAETAYEALKDIIIKTESVNSGKGIGVFYWEPQSYNNWNGYSMGAFDQSGKPTMALDAFK